MSASTPWRARLLRLPLFHKILYANLAVIALGAVAGTIITVWHVRTYPDDVHYELIALFVTAGVAISYLINRWVLKLALQPMDKLQAAVDRVRAGETDVRVMLGAVSDERFDRLAGTFNDMLLRLERDAAEKQRLSRRLIGAQEEERLRLARDLHDEAAQSLTSLLVRLRLLERAQAPEDAQHRVEELRQLTAAALEDVRRVALDLRPTILDDLGLGPALEWRVDELNKTGATQGHVTIRGMEKRLTREAELVFYRVAQEALSNVVRHARAANAWVLLERANGVVTLEVRDDGAGFDDHAIRSDSPDSMRSRGLGLLGMRERMATIGGEVVIQSMPGKGTTLRAHARDEARESDNG